MLNLLQGKTAGLAVGKPLKNKVRGTSLQGGPTSCRIIDPKMNTPDEYRRVTGEIPTVIPASPLVPPSLNLPILSGELAVVRSYQSRSGGHT